MLVSAQGLLLAAQGTIWVGGESNPGYPLARLVPSLLYCLSGHTLCLMGFISVVGFRSHGGAWQSLQLPPSVLETIWYQGSNYTPGL